MAKNRRTTLNEILGGSGDKRSWGLSDLPNLLGEKMPKLEYHPVGRLRLVRALSMRFGPGYRNIPGVSDILKEFEDNMQTEVITQKIKNASRRT